MKYTCNFKTILSIICISVLLSACASSQSGSVYNRDGVQQQQTVKTGIIESVRIVEIEGTRTPIGTVAGTIIGGIAGSSAGGGRGSQILASLGAVIGGLLGAATEEAITKKEGLELTVQIDGGELVAIVQENDENNPFKAGDTVRLVESGSATRVTH
jgi:outer membrane lipoprotein SlyB